MRTLLGVMVLAFSLSCWAQSQEPPKGVKAPINEKQVQGADKAGNSQSVKNVPSTPSVPLDTSVADIAKPVGADNPNGPNQKPEKDWMHELKTDPIATFTGLLFAATVLLWLATRKLVISAEKSAEKQLRAYVVIDWGAILLNSPSQGKVTAWIRLKNFGVTPAYKLKAWNLFHRKTTSEMPFSASREFENESIVGPGGTINLSSTLAISTEQLQEINDKTFSFFVWGRVEYVDIFKKSRFFTFKGIMNGPLGTVVVDGVRAEGWGLRSTPSGCDAD